MTCQNNRDSPWRTITLFFVGYKISLPIKPKLDSNSQLRLVRLTFTEIFPLVKSTLIGWKIPNGQSERSKRRCVLWRIEFRDQRFFTTVLATAIFVCLISMAILNWPSLASFSLIFGLFKQAILTTNIKNVSDAGIGTHEFFNMESPPVTTRPGLPFTSLTNVGFYESR